MGYAAYILNRAPTSSNEGRASPMKVLTKQTPTLGEIVVFGSPCTVYRDPRKQKFAHRGQPGFIVGIGEGTKGYRVYLPKDKVVVVTQYVKNIETLDKTHNKQVQALYLQTNSVSKDDDSVRADGSDNIGRRSHDMDQVKYSEKEKEASKQYLDEEEKG